MRVFDLDRMNEALATAEGIAVDGKISIKDMREMLAQCEPVDVVQVVRCRDCIYFNNYIGAFGVCTVCSLHSGRDEHGDLENLFYVKEDWFCGSGERSEFSCNNDYCEIEF